jgi:hypothetical protein
MMYFFLSEKGASAIDQCLSRGFWDMRYEVSVMSQPGQQHGLPGLPVPGTNW